MAEKIDAPVVTKDIDMFDAMTADKFFSDFYFTLYLWCSSFQGRKIGNGMAAGPITKGIDGCIRRFC
ncbi:MAG: hypothetical protein Ct9H300mP19_00690 [Dehalococcoidia bacterium]|nr:MAG: hypothetical protein Ct9H300mP19_00690 [Dehalococcoidia bacterium]